jgi:hypothetical protein
MFAPLELSLLLLRMSHGLMTRESLSVRVVSKVAPHVHVRSVVSAELRSLEKLMLQDGSLKVREQAND